MTSKCATQQHNTQNKTKQRRALNCDLWAVFCDVVSTQHNAAAGDDVWTNTNTNSDRGMVTNWTLDVVVVVANLNF